MLARAVTTFVAAIVIIALVINVAPIGFTQAATLQELAKKKTDLQKAIEAKQKEAEDKKKAADAEKKRQADLNNAIKKLSNDISSTENRINDTQQQITTTQGSIEEQQKRIEAKAKEIEQKRADINETAVEYHIELDQGNEIYTVLGSDRISSVIDRATDLNSLSDKLVFDSENLSKEKEVLQAEKASLEQHEQDLKNQKNQLAAYQRALDGQKNQKAILADQSKQAQQKFLTEADAATQSSQELKKQFAAVANEEAAMRRSASKKSQATAIRSGDVSKLGFVWPVDGVITTNFGGRTPFQNFHTGLDIAGPAGDPIVATSSGTVSVATTMCCSDYSNTVDKSYGYGNWIEIKHDNGYVSRYGHLMEFLVSPGDHVSRGQVIAYRGGALGMRGAGWSTGAHLHFEVWDAQGPFDPLDVLP